MKLKTKFLTGCRIVMLVLMFVIGFLPQVAKADETYTFNDEVSEPGVDYVLHIFTKNGHLAWTWSKYKYGNVEWSEETINISNPGPDDSSSGPKGGDPSGDLASIIVQAIKDGKIAVIAGREDFSNSGLYDYLSENGFVGGFDPVGNPSEDGLGTVGISGGIGGGELQAILAKIADLKNSTEIYGSGSGGFIDEGGEFNPDWNKGNPPGGGNGGGNGKGNGDGNTDRTANENGYFHDWSATDGLTIHPQANPVR